MAGDVLLVIPLLTLEADARAAWRGHGGAVGDMAAAATWWRTRWRRARGGGHGASFGGHWPAGLAGPRRNKLGARGGGGGIPFRAAILTGRTRRRTYIAAHSIETSHRRPGHSAPYRGSAVAERALAARHSEVTVRSVRARPSNRFTSATLTRSDVPGTRGDPGGAVSATAIANVALPIALWAGASTCVLWFGLALVAWRPRLGWSDRCSALRYYDLFDYVTGRMPMTTLAVCLRMMSIRHLRSLRLRRPLRYRLCRSERIYGGSEPAPRCERRSLCGAVERYRGRAAEVCSDDAHNSPDWPIERISEIVQPTAAQRPALDELRAASAKAIRMLKSRLPEGLPASRPGGLRR